MSNPAPKVDCDEVTAGLAVPDVNAAVEFYTSRLGFTVGFLWGEPPTFAGVELGRVRLFLQQGTPNPGGSSSTSRWKTRTRCSTTSAATVPTSRCRPATGSTGSATTRCAT